MVPWRNTVLLFYGALDHIAKEYLARQYPKSYTLSVVASNVFVFFSITRSTDKTDAKHFTLNIHKQ